MRGRGWMIAAIAFLAACVLLGGASAAGAAANALLQASALGLIVALLWRRDFTVPAEARPLLWIGGAFLLVGLLSLVPLPASLWSGLPFRDQVLAGFRLIGVDDPSIPLSLTPQATLASLLALLPPAAMFLVVLQLRAEERRRLPLALLALAAASIVLGAFQLLGGPDSPLRFYAITNPTSPVGFFANANHEATLLLCALPFAAFLAGRTATRRSRSKRSGGAIISVAVAVFLMAGIAISGSSAGYGLFIPTAIASLLIYRRSVAGRVSPGWAAGLALFLIVFAAAALRGPLSTVAFSGDLSAHPSSRRILATTTSEAVRDSLPVGTGLGSFASVYRRYEDPNRVTRQYANHAHNDYLEFVLELGVAGLLLMLAFIAWWVRALLRVWRRDFSGAALARAGSVVIGIVLLHSIVDYPVRTAAVAAVAALACALLVPPAGRRDEEGAAEAAEGEELRHLEAA